MTKILLVVLLGATLALAQGAALSPIVTQSGLRYTILKAGDGPQPRPGQIVVTRFVMSLADGTVLHDMRKSEEPENYFVIGKGNKIKGVEEGLLLMHVGDTARLEIPPALAFGNVSRDKIPAGSTIIYEVELLAAKDGYLSEAWAKVIDAEGMAAGIRIMKEWKKEGLGILYPDVGGLNDLGYRYLKGHKLEQALLVFKQNIEFHPKVANIWDSLAEARLIEGDATQALACYEEVLKLNPRNEAAKARVAELRSSPDAAKAIRERMLLSDDITEAAKKEATSALPGLRTRLYAALALNPTDVEATKLVVKYTLLLERLDLQAAAREWLHFADNGSFPTIQKMAQGKIDWAQKVLHPVDLEFTAIDGRAVDLTQLRGKVVLVDFWATWCAPCLEEIPNVVAAYGKYHDQGFEVVGVSFDQAPDPTKPAKRQKTAEQVLAFTKENKMPWPQYYDGKYWANELGKQYGITGIPAMFLLDQNGMIVSTNARGAALEENIRTLLISANAKR